MKKSLAFVARTAVALVIAAVSVAPVVVSLTA
jgi:hypothetical protein